MSRCPTCGKDLGVLFEDGEHCDPCNTIANLRAEVAKWQALVRAQNAKIVALGCAQNDVGTWINKRAEKAEAERDALRAQSEIDSKIIGKAHAEILALQAALDPERIIAEIGLPGGYYYDPQAIADAIRVYCCRAALAAHGNT